MHVPDNKKYSDGPNCGLMYIHGGAGIWGSPEIDANQVDRFAVETGCTIFNIKYRLAPENPAPAGMEDAFNAFTYIAENSRYFNVHEDKLAYFGGSGGAWIASGVGMMLAEQGLSHYAQF
jgi:acetyl esterase/lipase